jgi:GH24 family phage-related lysozyme (muramidase)
VQISDNGLNLIKQAEGFVPHVYPDAHGKDAIGYGHNQVPSSPRT